MNNLVILISGKQGSGKTTLSKNLDVALSGMGRTVMVLKFAAPLYEMHDAIGSVAKSYNIPFAEKEGTLLQFLGTEWGRKLKGENVWVDAIKARIDQLTLIPELSPKGIIFIIDDCRFKNEFHAFPDAFRIRLEADEDARKSRTDGWRDNTTHQSEIDLDDVTGWDIQIQTQSNLKSTVVAAVLEQLMPRLPVQK